MTHLGCPNDCFLDGTTLVLCRNDDGRAVVVGVPQPATLFRNDHRDKTEPTQAWEPSHEPVHQRREWRNDLGKQHHVILLYYLEVVQIKQVLDV